MPGALVPWAHSKLHIKRDLRQGFAAPVGALKCEPFACLWGTLCLSLHLLAPDQFVLVSFYQGHLVLPPDQSLALT